MYVYTHICMSAYVPTYMHKYMKSYVLVYLYRLMHVCLYKYLNVYSHIAYIHTSETHDAETGASGITWPNIMLQCISIILT